MIWKSEPEDNPTKKSELTLRRLKMSKIKTLLLLSFVFLFAFASVPEQAQMTSSSKLPDFKVGQPTPDFPGINPWAAPQGLAPVEPPPPSPLAVTWQARKACPVAWYRTAGCCDTSGHFYVIGGQTGTNVVQNGVYKYFTVGDSWHQMANMTYALSNHGAVFHAPTNKIFVFGGYTGSVGVNYTQIYDINTNTWSSGANSFLVWLGTYGAAVGDTIFVTGSDLSAYSLGLWAYQVSTNTWSYIGILPGGSASGMGASDEANQKVYFVGGWPSRDTVTVYDKVTNTSSYFCAMPIGLHGLGAAVINNRLWMWNGGQSWDGGTNGVYSYDLSQGAGGTWSTENPTISLRFAGTYGYQAYPLYGDTWYLHSTNGSLGYPNCDTLHEWGKVPPPPPIDAMLLKINAPSSTTPPGTAVNPNVTIKNNGTSSISNIPVTIMIDSAGTIIYNQSTTVTGPLASGDTANVSFSPTFPVGPMGSGYVGTAYTSLSGDQDTSNDTLSSFIYLRGLNWAAFPPVPLPRYRPAGAADTSGHMYVIGGFSETGTYYSEIVQRFTFATNAWDTVAPLLTGGSNLTAAFNPANNKIYVPGGYSPYTNNLQIYDVATNAWSYGAASPVAHCGSPCAIIGDTLYVLVGSGSPGTFLKYCISGNSWSFGPSRSMPYGYGAMCAASGKIFHSGNYPADAGVWMYDPATNAWTQLPSLPIGRCSHGMSVINGKIVVYGGLNGWSNIGQNIVYVMNPDYPAAGWAPENPMVYGDGAGAYDAMTYGGRTRLCSATGYYYVPNFEVGGFPLANDVGVASIIDPAGIIGPDSLQPMVIVKNYGTASATFDVWFSVTPGGYADTVTGITLTSGAVDTVTFTNYWTPGAGFATVRCSTMYATDMDNLNDALSGVAVVADYIERFEGQDGGFVSNNSSGWQHGTLTGGPGGTPDGTEAWATVRTGSYANSANWTLTSVPYYALQDNPILAYWHWYENESYYDGYNVKMSTDGGSNWSIIHAWPGYGQAYDQITYSGNAGIPSESAYSALDITWKLNWMEVPVSNGQEFMLRWHFGSDASVYYWGTAVDKVCGLGFDTIIPFMRDVAVITINEPGAIVYDTINPKNISATARNFGEIAETFDLVFDITGPGAFTYSDTAVGVSLGIGAQQQVSFDPSVFPDTGTYNAMCYVDPSVPSDTNMLNDTAYLSFRVQVGDPDAPWEAMADVPAAPSGKNPKSGSCLKGLNATGLLYFLKASNKPDFYSYDPATNTWLALETIPKGDKGIDYSDGKYPKRGAAMEAYEPNKCLYVVRGNNRLGFWKYQADTLGAGGDTIGWSKLATIPAGAKRCKYGTGLTLVEKGGEDHLFLMKGAKTMEFYLYSIAGDSWMQVTSPPVGLSGKTGYKKGSIQAYDGSEFVYVLQGYYGSFFKYHVEMDSWTQLSQYNYKVMRNREGRKKKFKDGASMVYLNDVCYCLKGGNTVEVWKYTVAADSWTQMPDNWNVPLGPTGRKKVKDGGGMTMFGNFFWATKGKNTPEFYRHFLPVEPTAAYSFIPTNEGTMGRKVNLGDFKLTIAPNPAVNVAAVRYSIPVAGPVTFKVYNVTGALVKSHTIANPTKEGVFLVDKLPAGVYILRFNTGDIRVSRKLVLEK
jgi:hypothetical protein